ncbi:MAG: HAMP domain-containing histidine kinase [Chloroflexi bacterium]|nr:HAMP domain-containing histidine kinase [Chloroflexota bacterium]
MQRVIRLVLTALRRAYEFRHPQALRPYLEVIGGIVGLSLVLGLLGSYQDVLPPDALYLLLVLALALRWGLRVGLVSSLLSVAAENLVNPDQLPTRSLLRILVYLLTYTAVTVTVGLLASFHRAERLRAEEAAMHEKAAAEHQRRMVGILAHDLKAPLTAARGYVELALRSVDRGQNDHARKSLTVSLSQLDRLSGMITNLVEASRLEQEALKLSAVSLQEAIERAVTASAADQQHPILFDAMTAEGLAVRADGTALNRILDNLLANATKYSPPGKPVMVSVRGSRTDGEHLVIQTRVSDRGIGIPENEREMIFAPYYRGSNRGNAAGTGVGLYICRGLAQKMGGTLTYESNPGGGSVFVLALPSVGALDRVVATSPEVDEQRGVAVATH